MKTREHPTIVIAGTPGTGKSTLIEALTSCDKWRKDYGHYKVINVSAYAKEHNLIDSFDEELDCDVLDEDKLLKKLKPMMKAGGLLLEYHSSEMFAQKLVDVVFVTTSNNTQLYDRLKARGYNNHKIEQNVQCEIFQQIYQEAMKAHNEVG